MASAGGIAEGSAVVMREGKKAGPIILLSLALAFALVLLGFERFHGEKKAEAMIDRWTASDQRNYAEAQDARVKALERNDARTTEAIEGIRREMSAQRSLLERALAPK